MIVWVKAHKTSFLHSDKGGNLAHSNLKSQNWDALDYVKNLITVSSGNDNSDKFDDLMYRETVGNN